MGQCHVARLPTGFKTESEGLFAVEPDLLSSMEDHYNAFAILCNIAWFHSLYSISTYLENK